MIKKLLKILYILLWVVLTAGLFALLGYTIDEHNDTLCNKLIIQIDYGKSDTLISKKDILAILNQTGNRLTGQSIGYINFEKIEKELGKQPYVAHSEVYSSIDGIVEIDVIQRQPILRIFNQKNESYYLDANGNVLPINPAFSARVLVANGFIPEPYSKKINYSQDSIRRKDSIYYQSILLNLYKVARFIIGNKFLKAQIEQVYVDKTGEFELFPRVGNHIIVFGNADDIEKKFERLIIFYKNGLNKTGWNRYNVINIKYQNQVVCSKIISK
jgi:cell division protein FtsQ